MMRIVFDGREKILGCVLLAVMATLLGVAVAAYAQDGARDQQAEVKDLMDQAKDHGAKGQLPQAWWDLDHRYGEAGKQGVTDQQWAALKSDARRLVNMALFVESMRSQKSPLEALLGRYDQALDEIAAQSGVKLQPELTGDDRAAALLDALHGTQLDAKVLTDSLRVANRQLREVIGGQVAAQDSVITALGVTVSDLRNKLWDSQLRVGVAEADRSAAESVLTSKQRFADAVQLLRNSFSPQEGKVLLSPDGEVMIRLHGVAFGVGSAELAPGQNDLIQRLEKGLQAFAGATYRVDGHTDDTGSREANLRLSLRRAETVARLLEHDLKLPAGAIATKGFGPDRPVALNDTPEGRALNRRIDVVIVTGGEISHQ